MSSMSCLSRGDARRADLMAGLTGAIVVLPQGVAFATLAGMPPQYGLYSAMVPCVVGALFGSSRLMVTGPANAISLAVLGLIAPLASPETGHFVQLVITLSLMVGIWQLLLGLGGFGRLVSRVPHGVIVGFTAGAAVLIVNSQVSNLLGLDWARGMSVWQTLEALPADLRRVHTPNAIVAAATILGCVLARRWIRQVPHLLLGLTIGALVAGLLVLVSPSYAVQGVSELPGALPPLSLPSVEFETFRLLLVPSIAMTLLALAEAISIGRALALKTGEHFDGNREIIGQGLANVSGSFFSSYPVSGSFNRSGVNLLSGARSRMAAVFAAVFLVLLLGVVGPLSDRVPLAAVAGVLLIVAAGLIDFREIRRVIAGSRREGCALTLTFLLVLSIPLEWAVIGGIAGYWALGWQVPAVLRRISAIGRSSDK